MVSVPVRCNSYPARDSDVPSSVPLRVRALSDGVRASVEMPTPGTSVCLHSSRGLFWQVPLCSPVPVIEILEKEKILAWWYKLQHVSNAKSPFRGQGSRLRQPFLWACLARRFYSGWQSGTECIFVFESVKTWKCLCVSVSEWSEFFIQSLKSNSNWWRLYDQWPSQF